MNNKNLTFRQYPNDFGTYNQGKNPRDPNDNNVGRNLQVHMRCQDSRSNTCEDELKLNYIEISNFIPHMTIVDISVYM